jgi:hypothetical protein
MVDNYRIVYAYFMDTEGPEYKAPFNTLKNIPRVYMPEDIHQYRQGDQWRFIRFAGVLEEQLPLSVRRCGTGHLMATRSRKRCIPPTGWMLTG